MRDSEEIERKLQEKILLLENIRESLSQDLSDTEIDIHPAVLAQWHCVKALQWAVGESDEI